SRTRRKTRLVGDTVPAVDVIIVTCGENIDVILDTARAACAQNYPSDRFRVLVSDDGNDDSLQEAIHALKKDAPCELLYYRRPGRAGSKMGYKAGNMNAALSHLDTLGDRTEFCAFTDADMILEADFLRACLGHLLLDPDGGVAIVPQSYYNLPTNDPLFQSMYVFNHSDQLQRDSIGAAWETGPGVLFRRKALVDIGGFNTRALMEDVLCGMLLNGRGWHTILCHEQLQWGLVPDTIAGYIGQRLKWNVGTIRAGKILGFGFNTALLPHVTWQQRAVQLSWTLSPYLSAINRTLRSWAILLLMSSEKPLVIAKNKNDLEHMIAIAWLISLLYRLESLVAGSYCGYREVKRRKQGYVWLSPYISMGTVRELLPRALAGTPITFIPTGMLDSSLRERDKPSRPSLLRRLSTMVLHQGLWYHILVVTLVLGFVGRAISTARDSVDQEAVCRHIWTHTLAPGMDLEDYFDLLAPLAYAVLPPTVPPRRELLERHSSFDGRIQPRLPKPEYRIEQWNWWWCLGELPQLLGFAFGTLVRFRICPK
ncbi:nucleotide-diphospho-sugar transferase, partial [Rhizodiscina lignyota]